MILGFPNQVAELSKLHAMLGVIATALDAGEQALRNDDLGGRLAHAGLIQGRNKALTPEQYLAQERAKPDAGDQSHQTSARGLKEYCVKLRLLHRVDAGTYVLTTLGGAAATAPPDSDLLHALWHEAFFGLAIDHDGGTCHPYQNLLWLAKNVEGFTRALSPLAFEARSDDPTELARVAALARVGAEDQVRQATGTSERNWDNAKKILPHVAVELGDLMQTGQLLIPSGDLELHERLLADADDEDTVGEPAEWTKRAHNPKDTLKGSVDDLGRPENKKPHLTNGTRQVAYNFAQMADRTYRHDVLLREAVRNWPNQNFALHEADFDALLAFNGGSDLLEAKTLSNSKADHMSQVRLGLGQLKFYGHFSVADYPKPVRPVLVLERPVAKELTDWVVNEGISVLTKVGTVFRGIGLAFE